VICKILVDTAARGACLDVEALPDL
jgi:hypothetical protein